MNILQCRNPAGLKSGPRHRDQKSIFLKITLNRKHFSPFCCLQSNIGCSLPQSANCWEAQMALLFIAWPTFETKTIEILSIFPNADVLDTRNRRVLRTNFIEQTQRVDRDRSTSKRISHLSSHTPSHRIERIENNKTCGITFSINKANNATVPDNHGACPKK